MAERIGKAVLEITVDDREAKAGLAGVTKTADDTATKVSGIGTALKAAAFVAFAKIAVDALKTVVGGIVELGIRGAGIDDVANSFGVLSEKAGETGAAMLGQLRDGVKGTISDFDLMTMANKALGSGLVKSSDDMGILAAGARTLSKATGGTTAEAFETLTGAMASGRTAQLKQLGLFVDSKVAVEQYADKIGKSVSDLTDADRAQALAAASLAALRQRMKEIAPDAEDFGELIDQAKVQFQNFTDGLSVGIARSPVLRAAMTTMGDAIRAAVGPDQTALISFLVRAIENVAIFTLDVARVAVEAGRFISNAFNGVRAIFNLVFETLANGVVKANMLLAELADKAQGLPVVGQLFAGLGDSIRASADQAVELARGFGEAKNAALDSAEKMDAGFNAAADVIDKVQAAMINARDAAVVAGPEIQKAVAPPPDVVPRTEEATKKIADAYRKLQEEVALGTKVGLDKRLLEIDFAKQREIDAVKDLTGITKEEAALQVAAITEKYRQQTAAAQLGSDQIKTIEQTLIQDIALANATGTEQKLLQIQAAHLKEIESLAFLKENYGVKYTELVGLVNQKYQGMTDAANGHFTNVVAAAAAAGFQTKAEMQATADNAFKLWEEMEKSGKFSIKAVKEAHEKAKKAEAEIDGTVYLSKREQFDMIASAASGLLRSVFGKNKAAAIAATIIDTAAAVVKALASAPPPLNYVLAAAVGAAGLVQINKIRGTDAGFAVGTPNLDFTNFGRAFPTFLHRQEAVIPRGGGHQLAGEMADEMSRRSDNRLLTEFVRVREGLDALPATMKRAFRDAMLLAQ